MKKCVKQVISKNLPQIYLSLWCSLLVACSVKQTAVITAILTTIFTRHEGLVASWPRHLIGRRMTERPALSPSSILSPPLSHCSSVPAKKYVWLTFKNDVFLKFQGFLKVIQLWNCVSWNCVILVVYVMCRDVRFPFEPSVNFYT